MTCHSHIPGSLGWHRRSLSSMENVLRTERARHEEQTRRIDRLGEDIARLRIQIEEAQRLGKSSFDSERFLKHK